MKVLHINNRGKSQERGGGDGDGRGDDIYDTHVPGTVLGTLHTLTLFLPNDLHGRYTIISILQVRKQRHREIT